MTETTQNLLKRLTGFTPGKHISVDQSVYSFYADGPRKGTNRSSAHVNDPRTDPDVLEATAQLYAAAPDLHRIATEQAAEIERLREALRNICDADRVYGVTPQSNGAGVWHDDARGAIARAALEVTP